MVGALRFVTHTGPSVTSAAMTTPDLGAAKAAVDLAQEVVDAGVATLAAGSIDDQQIVAYDVAHAAAAVETSRAMLDYGAKGDVEARLACAYVADAVHELVGKVVGREQAWGVERSMLHGAMEFVTTYRDPAFLADLAGEYGPRHLDDDFEMVQDTFRRFAEEKIKPVAEHVHRTNADIPEEVISGLAEMGGFGLSVPGSTAAGPVAARATTSAWSSPPRSWRGARSAWAGRSSPDPRSSPVRWSGAGPRSRRRSGCPASPPAS
jgi:(2S)-methylsuccinyl-CoA dehydrogenase